MRVRFFSDWGPNDVPRVLVGISPDDPDRGEAREAVHVATQADIDAYPAAYAEYEKTVEAAKAAAAPADAEVHTTGDVGSSAKEPSPASAAAAPSGGSRSSSGGSTRSGGGSSSAGSGSG